MTTTFTGDDRSLDHLALDHRALDHRALDHRSLDVLFRDAHTAYSFTDSPVSDDRLAEIYDLVRHAPTAMNSQPLRVAFVRSDAAKARLLPHLAEGNRAKSQSAPVVAILAADLDFHEHLPRTLPQAPRAKDLFADETTRTQAAMFNATLQAGYFILAVRAAGLDAGPLGGFDKIGIDREFLGGTSWRSLLLVNIGEVADNGTFPRNPRLEHHEAVTVL
jgi:3-hydroxypropanoate dehydrogenase